MPKPPDCGPAGFDYNEGAEDRQMIIRFRLLYIANELKKHSELTTTKAP